MLTEKGVTFNSAVVDLDNKRFLGCKFLNCTLRYAGGELEWDKDTTFVSCHWDFFHSAKRTMRCA